jgi:hypothetical protein
MHMGCSLPRHPYIYKLATGNCKGAQARQQPWFSCRGPCVVRLLHCSSLCGCWHVHGCSNCYCCPLCLLQVESATPLSCSVAAHSHGTPLRINPGPTSGLTRSRGQQTLAPRSSSANQVLDPCCSMHSSACIQNGCISAPGTASTANTHQTPL